ncbi:CDP-diacylglycerol--glycerol-3-phosphate 3-phosphatidyltransferase [Candidatus Kaiserbacteria bacterium]|nr:MAG: CDP-diacylglycerol--glycerol-3-phosphate 3-phosphatidyltransferase [Candidatus Kaiserbacteria bacterium]
MIQNLPNALTILRIALTFVAIALVSLAPTHLYLYLFGIFIAAAATDFFDGYLARKFEVVSDFGKIFDPLSDKVLTFAFLIILVGTNVIPIAIILLLIARDLIVDGVRAALARDIVIPAIRSAKNKTALMFLTIAAALFTLAFPQIALYEDLVMILAMLTLVFSYVSAAQYAGIFYRAKKNLQSE